MIYQQKFEVTYKYAKSSNEMTIYLWRSSIAEVESFIKEYFPTMEIITIKNTYDQRLKLGISACRDV